MSRSNPVSNNPNPSTRWFEWHGSKGVLQYYDKQEKKNIEVKFPFVFLALDILSTVKGWHEASESGIFANEVRDTRQDTLVVRSFKGGELASGIYQNIRDRVGNLGGYFVSSIYIGYKDAQGVLQIGNLNLNGAALKAWSDFRSTHAKGQVVFDKAIAVTGYTDGQKGSVKFRIPKFEVKDVGSETAEAAIELDKVLQEYLKGYLSRPRTEAATPVASAADTSAHKAADAEFAGHTPNADADRIAVAQADKAAGKVEFDDDIPF